jgi:hypothetical protein
MTKSITRRRRARPVGGKSVRQIVEEIFAQKITINRGSVRHSSTIFMGVCEQLTAKSAGNDPKALRALMKYMEFAKKRSGAGPKFLILPERRRSRSLS